MRRREDPSLNQPTHTTKDFLHIFNSTLWLWFLSPKKTTTPSMAKLKKQIFQQGVLGAKIEPFFKGSSHTFTNDKVGVCKATTKLLHLPFLVVQPTFLQRIWNSVVTECSFVQCCLRAICNCKSFDHCGG